MRKYDDISSKNVTVLMAYFVECKMHHEDGMKNSQQFLLYFIYLFIYVAIYVMFNFAVRISLQVGTGKKLEGIDCHLT
jgi:hypothetical protein